MCMQDTDVTLPDLIVKTLPDPMQNFCWHVQCHSVAKTTEPHFTFLLLIQQPGTTANYFQLKYRKLVWLIPSPCHSGHFLPVQMVMPLVRTENSRHVQLCIYSYNFDNNEILLRKLHQSILVVPYTETLNLVFKWR